VPAKKNTHMVMLHKGSLTKNQPKPDFLQNTCINDLDVQKGLIVPKSRIA